MFTQMVGRGTRLAPGKTDCLVLDFTGNTQRHKLVSAVDILGDEIPDNVRRRAQARLDAGAADVLEAVEHAGREVEAERLAELKREVKVPRERVAEEVHGLLDLGAPPPTSSSWEPVTDLQRAALVDVGIPAPAEMSRVEAAHILAAISQRKAAGLATYKQVRWLAGQGIDAKSMPKAQATALIGARIKGQRGAVNRE